MEGSTGSRVQPLAHASYDAWIKAYRPNENSANTSMSYYSRGQIIASLMDIKIIANSMEKNLDDFMQHLYMKYYKSKRKEDLLKKNLKRIISIYKRKSRYIF